MKAAIDCFDVHTHSSAVSCRVVIPHRNGCWPNLCWVLADDITMIVTKALADDREALAKNDPAVLKQACETVVPPSSLMMPPAL